MRPVSNAATNEYGQPGIMMWLVLAAAVGVAQHPIRAGVGVRAQPRLTSTASTSRPSAARGSGSAARTVPQPVDVDPAVVERGIQGAVPASVLAGQRQLDQRPHRPVRAQHRVGQLEQRVRAGESGTA